MQMVKIRFTDPAKEAEGFVALAKQVRVICFADDTYEITKSHLKILDDLNIPYEVMRRSKFLPLYFSVDISDTFD